MAVLSLCGRPGAGTAPVLTDAIRSALERPRADRQTEIGGMMQ